MTGLLAAMIEALHLMCHFYFDVFLGEYLPGKCMAAPCARVSYPAVIDAQRDDCEHNYNQLPKFS